MTSKSKKDVLSTSMTREIASAEADKVYESQASTLSEEHRRIFLDAVKLDKYLIDTTDHAKWQEFCRKSCQTAEGAAMLKSLTAGLVRNDVHEYWLNSMFLEQYDKNPATALSELKKEYDVTIAASVKVKQASKILDTMESQISEWAKPENFAKLRAELQTATKELDDLLKTSPTDSSLHTAMAAKQFYRQIDIFDRAIKALQTSDQYADKTDQVKNFKALIGDFWEMVKSQEEMKSKEWGREGSNEEEVNKSLAKTSTLPEELLISKEFSVSNAIILRTTHLEFGRSMKNCKHLADLHMVIHQSAVDIVQRRSARVYQALEAKMPPPVRELCDKVKNSENSLPELSASQYGLGLEKFRVDLASVSIAYPKIELTYNIPLREHSAVMNLSYDQNTGITTLKYSFQGEGAGDEGDRWRELEKYGITLLTYLTDAKIGQHESTHNSLTLTLEIGPDCKTKTEITQVMNSLIISTFDNNVRLSQSLKSGGDLDIKIRATQSYIESADHELERLMSSEDESIQHIVDYIQAHHLRMTDTGLSNALSQARDESKKQIVKKIFEVASSRLTDIALNQVLKTYGSFDEQVRKEAITLLVKRTKEPDVIYRLLQESFGRNSMDEVKIILEHCSDMFEDRMIESMGQQTEDPGVKDIVDKIMTERIAKIDYTKWSDEDLNKAFKADLYSKESRLITRILDVAPDRIEIAELARVVDLGSTIAVQNKALKILIKRASSEEAEEIFKDCCTEIDKVKIILEHGKDKLSEAFLKSAQEAPIPPETLALINKVIAERAAIKAVEQWADMATLAPASTPAAAAPTPSAPSRTAREVAAGIDPKIIAPLKGVSATNTDSAKPLTSHKPVAPGQQH